MASSKTVICNLALSHLGVSKEIADLDTEISSEASACRRFYDVARRKALKDFNWPFATTIENLIVIEETPNAEWLYSYQYPVDCLNIRKIQSGISFDTRQSRINYRVSSNDSTKLIFCNEVDAVVEYTRDVLVVEIYPDDFVLALSYLLAHYISKRLTAGDPFDMGKQALQEYLLELDNARANALNEEQWPVEVESEFIRSRE